MDQLPKDEDIAFFREHGFWISPVIVPAEVLDAAERGMARYYAGDYDESPPGLDGYKPTDGLRKSDYSSLRVRELADLVAYPTISACAAALSGAKEIRLWHDQLLYKPIDAPGLPGNVGWHTDRQYWQTCTSEDMLTAWVAFHDVDETGGSVSFVDGSHRWNVEGLDFFSQDLDGLEAAVRRQGFPFDPRPSTLRRGQVTFHNCRTVHGSGPNRGGVPRRSLAIHLQPGDNRWRQVEGVRHHNEDLVRYVDGVADYTDPAVCPLLFPRP